MSSPVLPRRSTRERKPTRRYTDEEGALALLKSYVEDGAREGLENMVAALIMYYKPSLWRDPSDPFAWRRSGMLWIQNVLAKKLFNGDMGRAMGFLNKLQTLATSPSDEDSTVGIMEEISNVPGLDMEEVGHALGWDEEDDDEGEGKDEDEDEEHDDGEDSEESDEEEDEDGEDSNEEGMDLEDEDDDED